MISKKLKVTLVKSTIGRKPAHKITVNTLGLSRIGQNIIHVGTPEIRGMLNRVSYLLKVEECE